MAPACATPLGTTGNPKGVLYSHRSQVLHSMSQAMGPIHARFSQHDVGDAGIAHVPRQWLGIFLHHCHGRSKSMCFPVRHLDAESLLELIEPRKTSPSPARFQRCGWGVLQTLEKRRENWKPGGARSVFSAEAPRRRKGLIRNLDLYGFHVIHSWGMTETSPQAHGHRRLPPAAVANCRPRPAGTPCRSKQGWAASFLLTYAFAMNMATLRATARPMGELEVRGPMGLPPAITNAPRKLSIGWTADGWFPHR